MGVRIFFRVVNKDIWGETSEANQHVIRGCASLAQYAGTWRAVEYTQFTLNGLKAGGMTVGPAGEQLTADLKKIGETMTSEWAEKAGPEGVAIVEAFRASQ